VKARRRLRTVKLTATSSLVRREQRIIPKRACLPLPPSRLRSFSSRTWNEITSDVLDATELFTSDVIQPLYSMVPYSTSALRRVRYCVYISWRSPFLRLQSISSIKRIVPCARYSRNNARNILRMNFVEEWSCQDNFTENLRKWFW